MASQGPDFARRIQTAHIPNTEAAIWAMHQLLVRNPIYNEAASSLVPAPQAISDLAVRQQAVGQYWERIHANPDDLLFVKDENVMPLSLRTGTSLDTLPLQMPALIMQDGRLGTIGGATISSRTDMAPAYPLGNTMVAVPIVINAQLSAPDFSQIVIPETSSADLLPRRARRYDPFLALPMGIQSHDINEATKASIGLMAGLTLLSRQLSDVAGQDWRDFQGGPEAVRQTTIQITQRQYLPTLQALTDALNRLMNAVGTQASLSGFEQVGQRLVDGLFANAGYLLHPTDALTAKAQEMQRLVQSGQTISPRMQHLQQEARRRADPLHDLREQLYTALVIGNGLRQIREMNQEFDDLHQLDREERLMRERKRRGLA